MCKSIACSNGLRHLTDPCYTRLRLNTNERTSRAGYKHASHHQSSHIRRRSIAIIGIAASLFLILGVIVFNAHAGTMPGIKHSAPTFVAPAINPTRIHIQCHTPVHKVGDNILSIHSSGLNRTFIVHLAPSYGNQQHGGNSYMGMAAVQAYLNLWLAQIKCHPTPGVIFQKADVTGLEWSHCTRGTIIQHITESAMAAMYGQAQTQRWAQAITRIQLTLML